MSVESQIGDLVRAFSDELTRLIRDSALQGARELLGGDAEAPSVRGRRAAKASPAKETVSRPPAKAVSARVIPVPRVEESVAPPVDPWMKPLRPGVLETIEIKRPKRRAPKRRVEPRSVIPREPPVRAVKIDGVTIIPSEESERAPEAAPAVEAAPATPPVAGEPARRWVVMRRPARERSEAEPAELEDELFDL